MKKNDLKIRYDKNKINYERGDEKIMEKEI